MPAGPKEINSDIIKSLPRALLIIIVSIVGSVLTVYLIREINLDTDISYTDLISISLTIVTVILAATAIAIGLIGFYTVNELKSDARKAVKEEYDTMEKNLNRSFEQKFKSLEQRITGDIGGLNELNHSDTDDRS